MKKKLLILALMMVVIVSVFAISVSAEEADPYASYYDKVYNAADGTPLALYEKEGETYYPLAWFYDSTNSVYESFRVGTEVNFMKTDGVTPLPAKTDFTQNTPVKFTDTTKTYTMSNLILVNLQGSVINQLSGSWSNLPIEAIYCNVNLCHVQKNMFQSNLNLRVFDVPVATKSSFNFGGSAFWGCKNLKELYIPTNGKFEGGSVLEGSGVVNVVFADDWKGEMKGYAFKNCASLTSVTLPSTITSIGNQEFYNCTSLTSIDIPASVKSIGEDAFRYSGITSIEIPAGITSIGKYAFANCTALTTVTFAGNAAKDATFGDAVFEDCSALTGLAIPEGVVSFGNCFANRCSALASLSLPSTLASTTGDKHFCDSALTKLEGLENTQLTSIPYGMFKSAIDGNIGTLRLPKGVTTIAQYGFADANADVIILSPVLETFGTEAFVNCPSLKAVYVPDTITTFGSKTFNNNKTGNIKFFVVSTDETYLESVKSNFSCADVVTLETYEANESAYANGRHVISGVNLCDAFYDGHQIDESAATGEWLGQKYLSNYKVSCVCGRNCGKEAVLNELAPLFTSNGFAYSSNAMMQSFSINASLVEAYKEYLGEIKFGLVAAYCGTGENFDTTSGELVNADGNGINSKIAIVDFTERGYDIFEMQIAGVESTYADTEFYICAYVIENGNVSYINNNTTSDTASAVTYTEVSALDNSKYDYLPVAAKEEE